MKFITTFLVLALVFSLGIGLVIKNLMLPVSNQSQTVNILITKGSSVSQVANVLYKNKLIKNATLFKFVVQITNSQNKIQAGEFELAPNLSLMQILERLKKGPSEFWVTIPEGLRREEIALKFKNSLSKDDAFLNEFLSLTDGKEGYLFPDTYLFSKNASASQIVSKMTSTFDKKIDSITREQVIVASLLERETFSDDEKPIVAGIIYKRLENNWPLQIDATLQYAKDTKTCKQIATCDYWQPIFIQDKEINSAYNTYKNLGLPPSAISSPGFSSLTASINPVKSDYWYYIHDNSGKIHFAKTLEEHNLNVSRYLR